MYNGNIIENDRQVLNGKELDIYIPNLNLAIEFNGNYWHSDVIISNNKHVEKSLNCKNRGIRLIHVFEYEWDNNQLKIKQLLKHSLGLFDNVIYARKCTVKSIDTEEYINFLTVNHLDKPIDSNIKYGLFYYDELVSVIGIDKIDTDEYELKRYCVKSGFRIIGGLSKLLSVVKPVGKIVTFMDFSKFDGEGFIKNGFRLVEYTDPSFVCYNGTSKIYDKSEVENPDEYMKIYDCGQIKLML